VSNRAKRPKGYRQLFPNTTPMSIFELHERLMKRAKHVAIVEDMGWRHFKVVCVCGFAAPAPFGERQAQRIRDHHLARYGVAPDPMGAKYGN